MAGCQYVHGKEDDAKIGKYFEPKKYRKNFKKFCFSKINLKSYSSPRKTKKPERPWGVIGHGLQDP